MLLPHMHVTTLVDITNAAGTVIASDVRALRRPVHPSIYHSHLQPFTITKEHHRIWNLSFDAITTSNGKELHNPLGAWTSTPSAQRPYCPVNRSLFVQHNNLKWYQPQLCNSQQST
mmetsp:Transcript_13489/g.20529  ORF Transcript_13489/g.20529 Transcript_13489/m.20529 type:complete len:116 (-) Transcript_13489:405-752(-)